LEICRAPAKRKYAITPWEVAEISLGSRLIYSNSTKVLMDVEGGNNLMYLPLDKILEQNRPQEED